MEENGSQNGQPTIPEEPQQLPRWAENAEEEGSIEKKDDIAPTEDERNSIPPT